MRGVLYCTIYFILTPLITAQLVVTDEDEELTIVYDGITLIYHTSESPSFSIGIGSAEFTENLGSFEIEEKVTNITDLSDYAIVFKSSTSSIISFFESQQENIPPLIVTMEEIAFENETVLDMTFILDEGTEFNRLQINFYSETDEKLYGAGEQFTYFKLNGRKFPIWTSEGGVGRVNIPGLDIDGVGSYYTTYWPQASFFSSLLYSIIFENKEYMELNFESPDNIQVFSHSTEVAATVITGQSVPDLVPRISTFLGTSAKLPDWALKGSIIGLENGTEEMMQHYGEMKDAGTDISALWIQDWSGAIETSLGHRVYWNWEWDPSYYPDLDTTIQQLKEEDGVYVLAYCNPYLINGSNLFIEADDRHYFMTDADNNTFLQDFGGFYAGTIDLHFEEAKTWYAEKLRENMISLGIMGWMADFGEYIRTDMFSQNLNLTTEEVHNAFPLAWAETNKEIVEGLDDVLYFMRSGTAGSSGNQMLAWAGDQMVDFSIPDGVASTIVAALSLSVSGMGVTHFDIGGFTTQPHVVERSMELLLRSAEYAVFTPVMRTHLGNDPESNVQVYSSAAVRDNFARLTQLHSFIFNYTKDLVQQNANEGVPVQRPMFYHYENDAYAWELKYQYMYGPDLIVAPIITEGTDEVVVYIPEGDEDEVWIPLWDISVEEDHLQGPRNVTFNAPLAFPAVLYRSGSKYQEIFENINTNFGVTPPYHLISDDCY